MKRAVVLLSGGLDSATILALSRAEGFETYALSFRYGQRHEREIAAAEKVAHSLGARAHRIAQIDLRIFGGSALTADLEVPTDAPPRKWRAIFRSPMSRRGIRSSFPTPWPGRRCSARKIFSSAPMRSITAAIPIAGRNSSRPLSNWPTWRRAPGVEGNHFAIHAPLLALSKAEIIQRGVSLGVDYSLTHSCYDPTAAGLACGACDSCQLRLKGFREAGIPDPIPYAK